MKHSFYDEDKWITVHPNGADAKGSPVLLDDKTGVVKAGMGGKHNGEKINEVRKDFVGAKTPKGLEKAEPKKAPEPKASKPAESKVEEPTRVSGFYALAKRNHELETAQKQELSKEEPKEKEAEEKPDYSAVKPEPKKGYFEKLEELSKAQTLKLPEKPDWESDKAVGIDLWIETFGLDEGQNKRIFIPKSLIKNGEVPRYVVENKIKEAVKGLNGWENIGFSQESTKTWGLHGLEKFEVGNNSSAFEPKGFTFKGVSDQEGKPKFLKPKAGANLKIINATEKAVYVKSEGFSGWLPKSQIGIKDNSVVSLSRFIADEKRIKVIEPEDSRVIHDLALTDFQSDVLHGGKHWKQGGMWRIYPDLKALAKAIGFEYETYKTGNIRSARLDGSYVSNKSARGILEDLKRTYFDRYKNELVTDIPALKEKFGEVKISTEKPAEKKYIN